MVIKLQWSHIKGAVLTYQLIQFHFPLFIMTSSNHRTCLSDTPQSISSEDSQVDLFEDAGTEPSSSHSKHRTCLPDSPQFISSEDSDVDLFEDAGTQHSSPNSGEITCYQIPQDTSPSTLDVPSHLDPEELLTLPNDKFTRKRLLDVHDEPTVPGPSRKVPKVAPASVRGKKARRKLLAEHCHSCIGYWNATGLSESEIQKELQRSCRHRTLPGRSKTPPGLWDLEITDQEMPEEPPSPPRMRQNKYLKKSRL